MDLEIAVKERVNLIGVGVNPVTMSQTLEIFDRAIAAGGSSYVCCAAVHSVLDAYRDSSLRAVFNRSLLTTPDGMPLVAICRLAGHAATERVYGPDLLMRTIDHSRRRGYRHFFLGAQPAVLEAMIDRLGAAFPGFHVAGWLCPEYRNAEFDAPDQRAIEAVRDVRPDILWVALGTGKQERWMAMHLGHLDVPLMIGVGVAFDYLAGFKPQAPRWLRKAGLEWLFRLATEPRRLWRRYLEYPRFACLLVLQALGLKVFPMETQYDPAKP